MSQVSIGGDCRSKWFSDGDGVALRAAAAQHCQHCQLPLGRSKLTFSRSSAGAHLLAIWR